MDPLGKMTEDDIRPDNLKPDHQKFIEQDIQFLLAKKNDFINIDCPACDAHNNTIEITKNGFNYIECEKCTMLYMSPRPPEELLKEFYSKSVNYKFFNDFIFPASKENRRDKIFIPRVHKVLHACNKYNVRTGKILEIGTGYGLFCEEMAKEKAFDNIAGIEASDTLYETCRDKGFRIYNGILEDLEINDVFDVIVSFEVIEHICNPFKFLSIINKLQNKKGILMLTFPNYNGFDVGILRELSSGIDHEHQNYFNEKSISIILERTGFSVLSIETPGYLDVELVRKAILDGFKANSFIRDLCLDKYNTAGNELQGFLIRNRLSSHMMVIAQKTRFL